MPDRIIRRGEIQPKPFSLNNGASSVEGGKENKPDMEELLKKEYERGFLNGQASGKEEVKAQLDMLKKAVEEFSKQKQEAFKKAERQMVELSLKIARAIIGREASVDKEAVVSIVRDVLDEVKDKSKILLFIHPDDESVIREHLPKFMAGIEADIELIADDSVEQGGCLVQTPSGRIDALVSTQIEEMRKRLL